MMLNKRIFKSLVWLETKKEIQVYGSIPESRKIARGLIIYDLLNRVKYWLYPVDSDKPLKSLSLLLI